MIHTCAKLTRQVGCSGVTNSQEGIKGQRREEEGNFVSWVISSKTVYPWYSANEEQSRDLCVRI